MLLLDSLEEKTPRLQSDVDAALPAVELYEDCLALSQEHLEEEMALSTPTIYRADKEDHYARVQATLKEARDKYMLACNKLTQHLKNIEMLKAM